MRAIFISLMAMLVGVVAYGAEVPSQASREVQHLLDFVGRSGCEFYRNGSWHQADKARDHLERKYKYLAEKGRIRTAEDFITHGATESSLSRKPYHVRCGTGTQLSAVWLRAELLRFRKDSSQSLRDSQETRPER